MVNQDSSGNYLWSDQLNNWSKTKGLENYLGTGLKDSTIGKSGFYDAATQQGSALRAQNIAQAQALIGQPPVTGINPTAGAQQLESAAAQRAKLGREIINSAIQGAQGNAQSNMDWINQMMGSESQAVNANNQNWQNYQQAMYQGAVNDAQSKNSATGSMYAAGGAAAGAIALAAAVAI